MSGFTIEVTTTDSCNFDCDYCFEREFNVTRSILDDNYTTLVKRINELIYSEWLMSIADDIQITFWGGEPTLNIPMIENIVRDFKDDQRIKFYVYTNGSRIEELMPTLLSVKPRFKVQVSYDGLPIHDLRRTNRKGNKTSQMIRKAITLLKDNGIPFGLKSTVMYEDFKHTPEAWDDIYSLKKEFDDTIKYALTVDYHNVNASEYIDEIEEALLKIARKEINYYKETGEFLSNIFSSSKRICQTDRMITVDTKGKVYLCHGCIYSDESDELYFTDIFDDSFVKKIEDNFNRFSKGKQVPVEECSNCVAVSCLRCSVKKFENSNKTDLVDKWYDYACQKDICEYYKLTGKIGRAVTEIIKEE